ncbi:unnamed protein product, partial [Polarella glacialis]
MARCICLIYAPFFLLLTTKSQATCDVDGACDVRGSSVLQVTSKRGSLSTQTVKGNAKGPRPVHAWTTSTARVGSALDYFQWWAAGKVDHKLARSLGSLNLEEGELALSEFQTESEMSTEAMKKILVDHRGPCPDSEEFYVHQAVRGKKGVQHAVMRTPGGILQYLAVQDGRILTADPEFCPCPRRPAMIQGDLDPEVDTESGEGEEELLDVRTDPMVKDCVALFHQTAQEKCHKDFHITVVSATVEIIDGFRVTAKIEVTGPSGKVTRHDPECDFEIPRTPDATLLQNQQGTAPLEEQKEEGLVATLKMHIDICNADTTDSVTDETASVMQLMN